MKNIFMIIIVMSLLSLFFIPPVFNLYTQIWRMGVTSSIAISAGGLVVSMLLN